ncbi:MAG: hypothetical protein IPH08_11060 [Rhodocyclaceae bacterium]|nr:hypothetical protein [Rhodocyclaceae bacterium]
MEQNIQLIESALCDTPEIKVLEKLSNVNPATNYIVCEPNQPIEVRTVPQRNGRVKFIADAMQNPHSITVHFGGPVGDRLLPGSLGCGGADERSIKLATCFAYVVRRDFEFIKSFYVGAQAVRLLDSGYRPSQTAKSSQEYDLCR